MALNNKKAKFLRCYLKTEMCECRVYQRSCPYEQRDEIDQQVSVFLATPLSLKQYIKGCFTGLYYLTLMKYFNPEKYELASHVHQELIKQRQKRE
jgi:hypothetical protein